MPTPTLIWCAGHARVLFGYALDDGHAAQDRVTGRAKNDVKRVAFRSYLGAFITRDRVAHDRPVTQEQIRRCGSPFPFDVLRVAADVGK